MPCAELLPFYSDESRKLEQRELEAAHADAWAIGGSDESDCVCRGGRCPRMWDCPFWVDRRRAEAKGSCAHVGGTILVFILETPIEIVHHHTLIGSSSC